MDKNSEEKDNKGIISFSLESLKEMKDMAESGDYNFGECFFVRRDLNSANQYSIFRYPCRIDAYIAILCTAGSARFISNLNQYIISKNSLFISNPNDIIQLESLDNCKFYVVALNDNFVRKMKIDYQKVLSVFLEIQKTPLIEISQEEADILEGNHRTMLREIDYFKGGNFYTEIMMTYISMAVYEACSIITSRLKCLEPNNEGSITSRNEEYYKKFMTLLSQNFKREHGIGFYASEICITPKYLSSLVKRVSGKSATQWINESIIMEAKHLLKYSKMTVQEISFYLNFPNQSFFTQYFKRQTNLTPSEYRVLP
jgi:AraC family transcriptional regulator, transcriptional activator of pobA